MEWNWIHLARRPLLVLSHLARVVMCSSWWGEKWEGNRGTWRKSALVVLCTGSHDRKWDGIQTAAVGSRLLGSLNYGKPKIDISNNIPTCDMWRHEWVTRLSVWIDYRIYWMIITRKYKELQHFQCSANCTNNWSTLQVFPVCCIFTSRCLAPDSNNEESLSLSLSPYFFRSQRVLSLTAGDWVTCLLGRLNFC